MSWTCWRKQVEWSCLVQSSAKFGKATSPEVRGDARSTKAWRRLAKVINLHPGVHLQTGAGRDQVPDVAAQTWRQEMTAELKARTWAARCSCSKLMGSQVDLPLPGLRQRTTTRISKSPTLLTLVNFVRVVVDWSRWQSGRSFSFLGDFDCVPFSVSVIISVCIVGQWWGHVVGFLWGLCFHEVSFFRINVSLG